jgi:acyl-CoA thioester hydrolase
MMYFAENGFPTREFSRLKLGPVVMRDEVDYHREVNLLQEITVTLALAGLSPDGSRFRIRNEFRQADGKVCAIVTSSGGWLDLSVRKLVAPPEALSMALRALSHTRDFEALPSSLGK